jgi:hypothetical protein
MKQKLFLALPVYGQLEVFFTQCLVKLLTDPPCEISVRMNPGDSLVSRARNSLTADFLESDCTDLVFIDSDIIFSGEHVRRLLGHDVDIVGGFYPKKQEGPIAWVCNGCLGEERPILPSGLQEVRYMGTGFLRVKRHVFEKMIESWPEMEYKPDHRERREWDFWSVGVYRNAGAGRTGETPVPPGRYLSEDWYFCQRWLDLGGKVWGDTGIVLKHVGQAVYPLRSQEELAFGKLEATAGSASHPHLDNSGSDTAMNLGGAERMQPAGAGGSIAPAPALSSEECRVKSEECLSPIGKLVAAGAAAEGGERKVRTWPT